VKGRITVDGSAFLGGFNVKVSLQIDDGASRIAQLSAVGALCRPSMGRIVHDSGCF